MKALEKELSATRSLYRMSIGLLVATVLAACGGGGSAGGEASATPSQEAGIPANSGSSIAPGDVASAKPGATRESPEAVDSPATREQARRFLTQASFGPVDYDLDRLTSIGYSAWIDEQAKKPITRYRASWEAQDAVIRATQPNGKAHHRELFNAFYTSAIMGQDQLRQRVALALSEIFVISLQDPAVGGNPRGAADFLDLLTTNAFGNYRTLLEKVSLHPMMGAYLSHLGNRKEDVALGRVPDENYAREVMQLFSIGLHQLNIDGTTRNDANGQPLPTYTSEDVAGLAKVFTGWSWAGPDISENRFRGVTDPRYRDPDRTVLPMQPYPHHHSTSEKRFLGAVVPAQSVPNPAASLRVAMDTLAAHPNVGPFLARQLIQRLVTSNPSPAYVARVALAFNGNGGSTRGNLGVTVRAVLLDPEARDAAYVADPKYGKLREPVLRLTAALRAFRATSDSGKWLLGSTDDPGTSLGQSPISSRSVFNFFRPGYVAPGTLSGQAGVTTPELQITHETTVAGYVNYMLWGVKNGLGAFGENWNSPRRDVQYNFTTERAMADKPVDLVNRVTGRLIGDQANAALKTEIRAAVESVVMPAPRTDGANQWAIDYARRDRVHIAVFLAIVSPEFLVQK